MPKEQPPRRGTANNQRFEDQTADALTIDDLALPRSMVQRLAKGVLSPNSILGKEATMAFAKSATVFVTYLASSAKARHGTDGKKTIQPQDVLAALKELEFDSFLPRCEAELERYNAIQCDKRNAYRRRVREDAQKAGGDGDVSTMTATTANGSSPAAKRSKDEPSSAKRARMSNGVSNGQLSDDDDQPDGDEAQDDDDDDDEDDDEDDTDDEAEAPVQPTADELDDGEEDAVSDGSASDDDDDEDDDDEDSDAAPGPAPAKASQ